MPTSSSLIAFSQWKQSPAHLLTRTSNGAATQQPALQRGAEPSLVWQKRVSSAPTPSYSYFCNDTTLCSRHDDKLGISQCSVEKWGKSVKKAPVLRAVSIKNGGNTSSDPQNHTTPWQRKAIQDTEISKGKSCLQTPEN